MNPEMEMLYKQIGQSIVDSIPGTSETAQLIIELAPGVVTAKGSYVTDKESEPHSFKVNYSTVKQFKKLHTLMAETPKGDWQTAKFIINKAGHFDLSFEY